jgi:hypothetical protein
LFCFSDFVIIMVQRYNKIFNKQDKSKLFLKKNPDHYWQGLFGVH